MLSFESSWNMLVGPFERSSSLILCTWCSIVSLFHVFNYVTQIRRISLAFHTARKLTRKSTLEHRYVHILLVLYITENTHKINKQTRTIQIHLWWCQIYFTFGGCSLSYRSCRHDRSRFLLQDRRWFFQGRWGGGGGEEFHSGLSFSLWISCSRDEKTCSWGSWNVLSCCSCT